MNPNSKKVCVPVLKLPRRQWRIPRIDERARQIQARLKAWEEGITPRGRELLRKIILGAEQVLETGTQAESEAYVLSHMDGFQELRTEWGLILGRVFGLEGRFKKMTPSFFARLVAIHAMCSLKRKKANASAGEPST